MMKTCIKKYAFLIPAIMFVAGCQTPYNPPPIVALNHYLVVEGFINSAGVSKIHLSRTRSVADTAQIMPELYARVTVEDEHENSYPLLEKGNGDYESGALYLTPNTRYRLRILTAGGAEYLSDPEPVLQTPAIDSVSWRAENDELHIYVNTHDPQSNIRYYRWSYEATWEFHSNYYSNYKYIHANKTVVPRKPEDQVYVCWLSERSSNIILANSEKLSKDEIYLQPLITIPGNSEQLSVLYSLLVHQYAMSKSEYEYWQNMKKNSEQLGSIFDPQPSDMPGNIHCISTPGETVVGYVGVKTEVTQRIFIPKSSLPVYWNKDPRFCDLIKVPLDSLEFFFAGIYVPINLIRNGYTGTPKYCGDCTTRGVNVKPDFWP